MTTDISRKTDVSYWVAGTDLRLNLWLSTGERYYASFFNFEERSLLNQSWLNSGTKLGESRWHMSKATNWLQTVESTDEQEYQETVKDPYSDVKIRDFSNPDMFVREYELTINDTAKITDTVQILDPWTFEQTLKLNENDLVSWF